ncbi:hypothetical protein DL764_000962 [Monosporascus ibericus]|uniref:RING-type domain-containing protein n=1 Tax=Monosporascus ibericus TaxID=155417 RepID=A0A4Q4TUX1_9PEZI|nr:hypothetical protein DL764_000962 [Monosporascus ibericus]
MPPVLRSRRRHQPPDAVLLSTRRYQKILPKMNQKKFLAEKVEPPQHGVVPEQADLVEELITECDYWPQVYWHLENRHANREKAPRLSLTCSICLSSVLKFPDLIMSNCDDRQVEELTVAPCGHIIGASCLRSWTDAKFASREVPACPTCRFPFIHHECGHFVRVRKFSLDELLGLARKVPIPAPQGGRVHPYCSGCRREKLEKSVRGTLQLIFDRSHQTREPLNPSPRDAVQAFLAHQFTTMAQHAYDALRSRDTEENEWE